MTFYNIIFGFLFIAAFRGFLRSLNADDFAQIAESTTLMLMIFSDVIYTSHLVEERKRPYTVGMKFADLFSFIILGLAAFILDPTSENLFQVTGGSRFARVNASVLFWLLIALYWVILVSWNLLAKCYRALPRRLALVQPLLLAPLIVMLLLTILSPTSSLTLLWRVLIVALIGLYTFLYKSYVLNRMIMLKELTVNDVKMIRGWPTYEGAYSPLDYALREDGWLKKFNKAEKDHRYGAWSDKGLIGFSILTETGAKEAEFYIAIHPDKVRHGFGRIVTDLTVARGYDDLGLERIHLKVRSGHGGINLYRQAGFKETGEIDEDINGKTVHFVTMERWR